MPDDPSDPSSLAIHAAGGVVLGTGKNTGKIAIVRRRRYVGEVALPKGKLNQGEDVTQAALREVYEETGVRARIRKPAGTTQYFVNSAPKTVTYFLMDAESADGEGPTDKGEIASVEWVKPRKAVIMLTHSEDRNLISTVFDIDEHMQLHTCIKKVLSWMFGSPAYDRLHEAIIESKIELNQQIARSTTGRGWAQSASQFLDEADVCLKKWNIHQGWCLLKCAQRAMLRYPDDPDRVRLAAITLRQEASKVPGWRAQAIRALICESNGELIDDLKTRESKPITPALCNRVIEAIAHRDESANTIYHKIVLRRRSLIQLFMILLFGVLICFILSLKKMLPEPFADPASVAAVIIFGILGAALSVGHGLLAADISANLPAQQIGSFIVWMRPWIGATAALIALAFVYANNTIELFHHISTAFPVIAVIAFVAGYSERFIVGAIEKVSKIVDSDEKKG